MSGLATNRRLALALACVWTLVIMILCWMPTSGIEIQGDDSRYLRIPHLDKVVHAGMFALFGWLWTIAAGGGRRGWAVLAAGLVMAVGTEVVQGLPMVGRDPDVWDGLADTVGVTIGIASASFWFLRCGCGAKTDLER